MTTHRSPQKPVVLTKDDVCTKLATALNVSQNDARTILKTIAQIVDDAIKHGNGVRLGPVKITPVHKPSRSVPTKPASGETKHLPARIVVQASIGGKKKTEWQTALNPTQQE